MFDEYTYMPDAAESEELINVLLAVLGVLLVVLLIAFVFAVVVYVLQSLAMYTIAKRRGIKNPWLAWIPYASYWIAGSISDQYRYVAKGQVKNRRVVMLVLAIVNGVISFISGSVSGGLTTLLMENAVTGYESVGDIVAMAGGTLAVTVVLAMISGVVSIVLLVFWYMSLYDLYTSCDPKNNVLFLVLSIIFSVTQPFFMFACRNKDLGMPPRRPQPQWQPTPIPEAQPNPAPRSEPWENAPEQ